ncbi:MAG: amidohydrolase family protein [Planctomycetaceae bacterium]|nr:amidohydrolase family protein [Planctomycetaceae bacterium]
MNNIRVIVCMSILSASAFGSDQVPGRMPDGPVAIVGVTVHPISGPVIENGTILFEAGKITAVGNEVQVPDNAQTIKGKKLHAFPGLFEPYSRLGLVEINAVRASNDYNETGLLNPNVRANVSINPDSELFPVTRSNGVLFTMSVPSGGRIAGQGSILRLDGWTYEDMTVVPGATLVASIHDDDDVVQMRDFLEECRRYQHAREANSETRHDVRYESMIPVLEKTLPIIVHADRWEDINRVVAFARDEDLKLIVFGGYDAPDCAELLKKHKVPVILSSVHRKPLYRHESYDAAYTLPKRLADLGIPFAISGYERSSSYNVRNLPYHAATAAAFGLSEEQALRAITLSPAEILGVADRIGSLETGKEATLFLATGSPLEADTQIKRAWIAGKPVDLSNKQTMLYKKYQQKYRE